jgi:hypothetical protein
VLYAALRDNEPLTVLALLAAAYGVDVSAYTDLPSRPYITSEDALSTNKN